MGARKDGARGVVREDAVQIGGNTRVPPAGGGEDGRCAQARPFDARTERRAASRYWRKFYARGDEERAEHVVGIVECDGADRRIGFRLLRISTRWREIRIK